MPDQLTDEEKRAIRRNVPLSSVNNFDLNAYMGHWYEIASVPMFFQRNCFSNVQAKYRLMDTGKISVVNQCETEKGKQISANGRARKTKKSVSQLEVTFLNFFGWRFFAGGDYWVIQVADDYSYAVVGHPERKYGWLLARSQHLPKKTLQLIAKTLEKQGYQPENFVMTRQSKGFQGELREPLTEYISKI
ncbi:MAG: lipocalin family protein [Cyanobacteria bacterium P01_H01_bin.74]